MQVSTARNCNTPIPRAKPSARGRGGQSPRADRAAAGHRGWEPDEIASMSVQYCTSTDTTDYFILYLVLLTDAPHKAVAIRRFPFRHGAVEQNYDHQTYEDLSRPWPWRTRACA